VTHRVYSAFSIHPRNYPLGNAKIYNFMKNFKILLLQMWIRHRGRAMISWIALLITCVIGRWRRLCNLLFVYMFVCVSAGLALSIPLKLTDEVQHLWLRMCDVSPIAEAHWWPQIWQTWAALMVVLTVSCFYLRALLLQCQDAGPSNSETLA